MAVQVAAAAKAAQLVKTLWDNKEKIIAIIIGSIAVVFILLMALIYFIFGGGVQNTLNIPASEIQRTVDFLNTRINTDSSIDNEFFTKMITVASFKTVGFTSRNYNVEEVYNSLKNGTSGIETYIGKNFTKVYGTTYDLYKQIFDNLTYVDISQQSSTSETIIDSKVINDKSNNPAGTVDSTVVGGNIQETVHLGNGTAIVTTKTQTTSTITVKQLKYNFYFPIKGTYNYSDTWAASRGSKKQRRHEGTDIMAEKGTPVVAVFDGVVEREGWNSLGGYRVYIRSKGNLGMYYAHFDKRSELREGDTVRKGEVIGYVGNSGGVDGTKEGQYLAGPYHLHLGMQVRVNGKDLWVNPYMFLQLFESNKIIF